MHLSEDLSAELLDLTIEIGLNFFERAEMLEYFLNSFLGFIIEFISKILNFDCLIAKQNFLFCFGLIVKSIDFSIYFHSSRYFIIDLMEWILDLIDEPFVF